MEDQQSCSNFNSIVLVGDSRVENLLPSFTWPNVSTKLITNSCKEMMIDDLINTIEKELFKIDENDLLMIVLGIHSDIMMIINQKHAISNSILDELVKKICNATDRWKNSKPNCRFVWCLPSVPDFKRYYNKACKKYVPYKEKDEEIDLVRKYFQTIKKLKLMWEEFMPTGSQVLVDLNLLGLAASSIANPQKTFAKFEDPEKMPSFVSAQTTDGFHLSLKMSLEFWKYIYNFISHPSIFENLKNINTIEQINIDKESENTPKRRLSGRIKQKHIILSPSKEDIVSEGNYFSKQMLHNEYKCDQPASSTFISVTTIDSCSDNISSEKSVEEEEMKYENKPLEFNEGDEEKKLTYENGVDELNSGVNQEKNEKLYLKELCEMGKYVNIVEGSKEDILPDSSEILNSKDKSKFGAQNDEMNQKKDDEQVEQQENYEYEELYDECDEEELIYEDVLNNLSEEEENVSLKMETEGEDDFSKVEEKTNLKKETEREEDLNKLEEKTNLEKKTDQEEVLNEDYLDNFFSAYESDDKFFMEVCETSSTNNNSLKATALHNVAFERKKHLQTSQHIMNVEAENIKSENDEDCLQSQLSSFERTVESQPEKEIIDSKIASTGKRDEMKANFEAYNKIQSDKVKEIVKMQNGRIQNNIVIVTDERDSLDVHLASFNSARVSVMKVPGLKMSDAFLKVKLHPNFGQGTVFVFSCGTHDLVQSLTIPDCVEVSCPYPQTILNLAFPVVNTAQYLADVALNLNIDILLATENDVAIFSGLIPVLIINYNNFAAKNRPCASTHPIMHLPRINSDCYTHYRSSVILYNNFIQYHATMLGYSQWNLESEYFRKPLRMDVLLENRYNLCPEEHIRRANHVKLLCTELLQAMASNKDVEDEEGHPKEYYLAISGIEKNYDLLNRMARYNDTTKRIAKQKMRMQNNIVIVTDDRDDFNIDYCGLEGKVSVLKKIGLTFSNAFSTVQTHPNFGKGTIFIFSCGTHDLLDSIILKECLQSGCSTPQTALTFNKAALCDSNYLTKKALRLNNDILNTTQNDIALFCGITPVRVLPYNEFTVHHRPCHVYHAAFPPYSLHEDYQIFLKSVASFEVFIIYHAETLGCNPWDMERSYYSRNSTVLLPNSYNICSEEQIRRAQKAQKLCAELLLHSSKAIGQATKNEQQSNISTELRQKLDNVKKNITFVADKFKELSLHGKKLQEIEKVQNGRMQNNVVIVSDERDKLKENFFNFDSNVDFLKVPLLKLGDTLSHIKKHPKFGKGTIFVFSCGTHDLLQFATAQGCLPNCLPPQTFFSLKNLEANDKHYLVKKALELNLEILKSTDNDIALFCGLIPVDVFKYNNFVVNNRPCYNSHQEIHLPNLDISIYKVYLEAILLYNNFIKYHAEKLSFSPWDLEQSYFSKNGKGILLPNCYDFTPMEAANRSDQAKLLCTELLLRIITKKSESAEQLAMPIIKQPVMSQNDSEIKPEDNARAELAVDNKKLGSTNKERQLNLIKIRYQDHFEKIKSVQKGRCQELVVIVTDDRDDFVTDADGFDSRVSFLKIPGLQLGNAYHHIKIHPNFGKGTSFVFICGTYDIINSVSASDCMSFRCSKPQTMFTLPDLNEKDPLYLINSALQLNFDILNFTPNDIALFSGLVPVPINDYNKYAADHRPCKQEHTLRQFPVISLSSQSYYEKCLINYNLFATCHSQVLKYNPWDFHELYFSETKPNIFRENFYHFSAEERKRRVKKAKLLCTVMLLSAQSPKFNAKSKPSVKNVHTPVFGSYALSGLVPTTSSISAPFVPAGQVLPRPSLEASVGPTFPMQTQPSGISNMYAEPHSQPSFPDMSSCSSFQQIGHVSTKIESKQYLELSNSQRTLNYDKIVIVADRHDAPFINHLANRPEVAIFADLELKMDYLQDFLIRKKDYLPPRTLYFLVLGIHAVSKSVPSYVCNKKKCAKTLEELHPLAYYGFDSFVQSQIHTLYNAISQVKLSLPSGSNIEILPPLPASLISDTIGHENFHQYNLYFPEYLLAKRMDVIEPLCSIWMDQISIFTKPVLAKYIETHPSIGNKLGSFKKFEVMNCGLDDRPSYNIWKEVVGIIIDAALGLPAPPEIIKLESSLVSTPPLDMDPCKQKNLQPYSKLAMTLSENNEDVLAPPIDERDLDYIIRFSKRVLNADEIRTNSIQKFQNVFVIKQVRHQVSKENSDLKNSISECNFKFVTMFHSFNNYGDDDVHSLLKKFGKYPSGSLCCLVFDLSIIATKQTISLACSKQSCSTVLLENALETPSSHCNLTISELEELIEVKIEAISSFIRKLNKKISVIVLPLVPSKIFCDDGSSSIEHKIVHSISEAGAYVVCGAVELWKGAFRALINSWNKLMENINRKYNFYDYIRIYMERGGATFPIEFKLSSFVQQWKEPDIWRAFAETFLSTLVSPTSRVNKDIEYKMMSNKMYIKIANISPSIPTKFLTEICKTVDKNLIIIFENGVCKLKNMKLHKALLLVRKLNEFRFGGSQLQATLLHSTKAYADFKVNLMQDMYISSIVEKVYLKWKAQIIENIMKDIHEVPDISSVKVYPCDKKAECKGYKTCPYYHSSIDQRRDPLLHIYSSVMCMHKKLDDDPNKPHMCKFSLNIYEVKFHEAVYQKILCTSMLPSKLCNKKELCPNAHLDSPELFFTSHCKDTMVFGADLTIKYFTGAIRSVKKIGNRCNLRILLISPSVEFIDVAVAVSKNLIKAFKLKICTIGKDICIPDSCEVILGDPVAFTKLDAKIFKEMKGVIIVDDTQRILENNVQTAALQKLFTTIKSSSLGVTSNTVFVYFGDYKSISHMRTLMEKTFMIKLHISVTGEIIRFSLGLCHGKFKGSEHLQLALPTKRGNASKQKSHSTELVDLEQPSKRIRSDKSKFLNRGSSNASQGHSRKSRSRTCSLSETSSSSSSKDSDSSDSKRNKRLDSNSVKQSKWSSPKSETQNKRSRSNSISEASSSIYKKRRSTIESRSEKEHFFSDSQEDIREYLGENLYKEYVDSIEKLRIAFEKEFIIFKDVPELCPNYEQNYENFNNIYAKQHKDKDKEHKDNLWNLYWLSKFEEIKKEDWQARQQKLYHEFKEKLLNKSPSLIKLSIPDPFPPKAPERKAKSSASQDQILVKQQSPKKVEEEKLATHYNPSSPLSGGNPSSSKETGSFSFNEALSMLERLSETMGFLGPSVKAMVGSSREFGPNSIDAYNVFTNHENVMVINMVLEKVKTLRLSASGSKLLLYEKAVDWIPRLLEEAKKGPVETPVVALKEESLPIDIEAIARITHGKSSEFTLKLIKTALAYEGMQDASKELVNDLFLRVCKIHFTLSMDD